MSSFKNGSVGPKNLLSNFQVKEDKSSPSNNLNFNICAITRALPVFGNWSSECWMAKRPFWKRKVSLVCVLRWCDSFGWIDSQTWWNQTPKQTLQHLINISSLFCSGVSRNKSSLRSEGVKCCQEHFLDVHLVSQRTDKLKLNIFFVLQLDV